MTLNAPELSPQQLLSISELASISKNWKSALNEISRLVRAILIFDNMVIYQIDSEGQPYVTYARALGRGQNSGEDVSWGESLVLRILEKQLPIFENPNQAENEDRLNLPYLLGVPIIHFQKLIGVLVLVRFGGPKFSQEDHRLVDFIARQVALLAARQAMEQESTRKEKDQQQVQLKEDFISTISHDLRTPLGFIKGYTTTLLRSDTEWDKPTQREFLEIIEHEADHLQELIDNLLDSTRLTSGQLSMVLQPVLLDALIKDVLERLRFQHPEIRAELQLPIKIKSIQGDPYRLSQVFQNILGNAGKYAPGSSITISINQGEKNTRISIQDQGPGIPNEYITHIFDRFYRTPDSSLRVHGSGLGLFITRKIIQAHGGRIKARSIVGRGTLFQILLPNN